jgi:7-keto-8-aminopelargonate synthetase-like enzyme
LGGQSPIISVLVGDEEATFLAGKFLFNRGYYVQSVTFPAVRYHAGVLRVQVNANHRTEAIDGLVNAFGELLEVVDLPRASNINCLAA